MSPHLFTEEDKQKFIQFMNSVANNATFTLNTKQVIEYYHLLSYMQKTLLPKIDAHILEVIRVVNPEPESQSQPQSEAGTADKG